MRGRPSASPPLTPNPSPQRGEGRACDWIWNHHVRISSPNGSQTSRSRWRTRLTWLSLAISLAWSAVVIVPDWPAGNAIGDRMLSPGDLSAAHAAFNTDCRLCHRPGTPQADDARWLSTGFRDADITCARCHANVKHTPAHHQRVAACSRCHHEHRGVDSSLVRVHDSHCLRCHTDMASHHDLPHDRPDVRSSLRFNHALHLRPGLARTDEPPAKPFRWQDISDDAARSQLIPKGKPDDAAVELDCSACHQSRRNSSSFEPIRFDKHCRTCHDLTFDTDAPTNRVPHGLQPADVLTFVRGTRDAAESPVQVDSSLRQAADLLFRGHRACAECHDLPSPPPIANATAAWSSVVISASRTDRWPRHVAFDHSSHTTIACRDCHAAAFPGHPATTSFATEALLPRLSVCTNCHSPAGGARHGCADCHVFH